MEKNVIEELAYQEYPPYEGTNPELVAARLNKRIGCERGIQLAIEKLEVEKLVEALDLGMKELTSLRELCLGGNLFGKSAIRSVSSEIAINSMTVALSLYKAGCEASPEQIRTTESNSQTKSNNFTDSEIKAALEVKRTLIQSKEPADEFLKSIYMAGEICMHLELINKTELK